MTLIRKYLPLFIIVLFFPQIVLGAQFFTAKIYGDPPDTTSYEEYKGEYERRNGKVILKNVRKVNAVCCSFSPGLKAHVKKYFNEGRADINPQKAGDDIRELSTLLKSKAEVVINQKYSVREFFSDDLIVMALTKQSVGATGSVTGILKLEGAELTVALQYLFLPQDAMTINLKDASNANVMSFALEAITEPRSRSGTSMMSVKVGKKEEYNSSGQIVSPAALEKPWKKGHSRRHSTSPAIGPATSFPYQNFQVTPVFEEEK